MTTLRAKILDEIIDSLKGTCESLEGMTEYYQAGELSIEDLEYIESEIFLCDGCGWWCETCECHNGYSGQLCDDCYEEEMAEENEDA